MNGWLRIAFAGICLTGGAVITFIPISLELTKYAVVLHRLFNRKTVSFSLIADFVMIEIEERGAEDSGTRTYFDLVLNTGKRVRLPFPDLPAITHDEFLSVIKRRIA